MSITLLLGATTTTKSSGSALVYLIPIVLFGLAYYFFIRPRQKAAQAQRLNKPELSIGDEVITIGGVRGVIVALDDELVTLATGQMPGDELGAGEVTHITFIRKAIGQQVKPPAPPEEPGAPVEDATDVTGEERPSGDAGEDEGGSSTS